MEQRLELLHAIHLTSCPPNRPPVHVDQRLHLRASESNMHIEGYTNAANLSRWAYIRCFKPICTRRHFLGLKHNAGLAEHEKTLERNDCWPIQYSRICKGESWNLTSPRGSVLRHPSYMRGRWWYAANLNFAGCKTTSLQRKEYARKPGQKASPTDRSWALCLYQEIRR